MINDSAVMLSGVSNCPLCGSNNSKLLSDTRIVLKKCRNCGIVFNGSHQEIDYDEEYFTAQYQKQYGKTYLEDFNNIYSVSLQRIKRILKIKKFKETDNISILDIGSALGFFLKAALDSGIKNITGIEISDFASGYCKDNFQIKVINESFMDTPLRERYDIISSWYFLEHLNDPLKAVYKIYNSLNAGGIFAFSAPSFFGPQYFFNRIEWQKTHPIDHRIDFSPVSAKKILRKIGFKKIYILPAGIHPERIVSEKSIFYLPVKRIYLFISRLFSFSDTIEVYALK